MYRKTIGMTGILLAVLSLPRLAAGHDETDITGILEAAAPSIVTVKVVIETEMRIMGQAQREETRTELKGVVADAGGLVMISNAEISADRIKETVSGAMMGGMDVKMTPSDFKVIFGDDEQEYPAFMVAKDTKLDLAFLQVENLGDRQLTAINFADSAKPVLGDTVVSVSRLQKGYDYAPFFATGRIAGVLKKPRKAWIIDGAISAYGLPIFSTNGNVLGVLITLAPTTQEEAGAGGGFGNLMRFMRGGGLNTGVGTFVLPGKVVNGLIRQSKKKAAEMLAEQAQADEGTLEANE
jgi:hypothetical protein